MKPVLLIAILFLFSLLVSCATGGRNDLVSKLCHASDRGDTVHFERSVDSLQAAALQYPRAYAELALVYRHRWRRQEAESMQADRDAIRMCVYHRLGMQADSVEMRSVYDRHRRDMYAEMLQIASGQQMIAVAERMMQRMDRYLSDFIGQARLSAYELVAELEMQFPGFLNNMERTLNGVLRSLHDVVSESLDSIYR